MQLNAKNIVAASLLIIALSFAYYFVIFLPEKEKAKLEQEKIEQEDKQKQWLLNKTGLENCLKDAEKTENDFWNKTCKDVLGKKDGCLLPQDYADRVDAHGKNLREECFKKYTQN